LYSPDVRLKAISALLGDRTRMTALIKALEDNQVERTALDDSARTRLLDHPDRESAERARALFRRETGDRDQAVASYRAALTLSGDVDRGKQVFETNCAKCHLPQRGTGRVGPDLSGISNKTKEELLLSILNPSYAIEPHFVNYIVTAKDGRVYQGVLVSETPGAITLRESEGEATILRRNIADIRASNISAMPDGFERGITPQAMADLIAYLRGGL